MIKNRGAVFFLFSLISLSVWAVGALSADVQVSREKKAVVVAASDIQASGPRALFLGGEYRALWTTPIEVGYLDMTLFAGGLTPAAQREGSLAKTLLFKGGDGRDYLFRSIDFDPAAVLPAGFTGTLSSSLTRELLASTLPAGTLCVSPIFEAAGIRHSDCRLTVLPDDPLLGKFRGEFAGRLGTISEDPRAASDTNPGFNGALEIVDSGEMLERLRSNPANRIDSRALLLARLADLLIGDWDRGPGRWLWARFEENGKWKPVSGYRDQAFASHSGLLLNLARSFNPQLVVFTKKIPSMDRMTWTGRGIDRALLSDIGQAEWMAVAQGFQSRITDEVIEEAVRRLPEAYHRQVGEALEARLTKRRDHFLNAARRFYLHLAGEVDIFGTDAAEDVEIWRLARGEVLIRMSRKGQSEFPYYERRFRPAETKEIRVYLLGGNDRVVVNGPSSGRITIRVIGGEGTDLFDDPRNGRVKFYDDSKQTRLARGTRSNVDKRTYLPETEAGKDSWLMPRDWGHKLATLQWLALSPETGAFIGGGIRFRDFGFRRRPYRVSHSLRMGYAAAVGRVKAVYEADYRWENSMFFNTVLAEASEIEMLRFFGWGNESAGEQPDDYYRIHQSRYRFFVPLRCGLNKNLTIFLGPDVSYAKTATLEDEIIETLQPYGAGSFGQVGLRAGVLLDTRRSREASGAGFRVKAEATWHPPIWDVKSAYASINGHAVASLSIAPPVLLALRMGGKMNFGDYPFHEAAFIGGSDSVRGYLGHRFAGDSCVYGNAELRFNLGKALLFLPGEYGIFALTDIGRVFLEGEDSRSWHRASGGGLFFSVVDLSTVFSLAVAKSDEHTSVYFKAGLSF